MALHVVSLHESRHGTSNAGRPTVTPTSLSSNASRPRVSANGRRGTGIRPRRRSRHSIEGSPERRIPSSRRENPSARPVLRELVAAAECGTFVHDERVAVLMWLPVGGEHMSRAIGITLGHISEDDLALEGRCSARSRSAGRGRPAPGSIRLAPNWSCSDVSTTLDARGSRSVMRSAPRGRCRPRSDGAVETYRAFLSRFFGFVGGAPFAASLPRALCA